MGNILQIVALPLDLEEEQIGNILQTVARPLDLSNDENQRFVCEICEEQTLISRQKFTAVECSHSLCIYCVWEHIATELEDCVGDIRCPVPGCSQKLHPPACATVLHWTLFESWCDVLCAEALLRRDKGFCRCGEVVVSECGRDAVGDCPRCNRRLCCNEGIGGEENGVGGRNDVALGIGVVDRDRDRNDVVLGEGENWMRCPECGDIVVKVDGCANLKCRCGTILCYECGKSMEDGRCPCYKVYRKRRFMEFKFLLGFLSCFYFFIYNLLWI